MNTALSDQQPRVSFLHCEELRALTSKKKKFIFGVLFFFVSSSLHPSRRTFSARGGGGGGCVRTYRTPLPTRLQFWDFCFTFYVATWQLERTRVPDACKLSLGIKTVITFFNMNERG